MFDTLYLLEDHSQSNNRLAAALVATVAFLGVAGTGLLAAERLQINRVSGPQLSQHLLFLPSMPMVPEAKVETPPDAPKQDAGAAAAPSNSVTPQRSDDNRGEPDPSDSRPPVPHRGGDPLRAPGNPFGSAVPGPGIGIGIGTGTGVHTPRTTPKRPINVRRSQLACTACPDPSATAIRAVAGASLRSGRNVTNFCVNEKGRVENVSTTKSAGDRKVDKLVRDTVSKWRLRAFRVNGQARRACTSASFNIQVR
jgi:TonB family protein